MNKKYNIAIDVSPLNDGNSVRGVGYYTRHLVAAIRSILDYNPDYSDLHVDLIEDPKTDLSAYHLVHYPYFDPFKLTLPASSSQRRIVTVHDLIPREFKHHFPVGVKGEIKWLLQKHRLCQSDLIITVSHYSKNVIGRLLHYPLDRIYVTYEAAQDSFFPRPRKSLSTIKNKYHLPDKFILFVGDINWNKNIPTLVKAATKLGYPLVIVGKAAVSQVPDHPWTQDIIWLQSQAVHNKNIILAGFVPDEDLPLIFNLATVYCQPSFAEGFGLPLVQAMQSGTPVVYSQASCLNEVMDYSGIMFDPNSIQSLIKALSMIWDDPKQQDKYKKLGLLRSAQFRWEFTAIETLHAYRLALIDEK